MTQVIYPDQLSGPRSYFTDIDPYDPTYNESDVIRKLNPNPAIGIGRPLFEPQKCAF